MIVRWNISLKTIWITVHMYDIYQIFNFTSQYAERAKEYDSTFISYIFNLSPIHCSLSYNSKFASVCHSQILFRIQYIFGFYPIWQKLHHRSFTFNRQVNYSSAWRLFESAQCSPLDKDNYNKYENWDWHWYIYNQHRLQRDGDYSRGWMLNVPLIDEKGQRQK